jgi:uncharacterized membrane protein
LGAGSTPRMKLADGLGWFSLTLGVPPLVAPGRMNRAIGAPDNAKARLVQRAAGVQELSAAAGLLVLRRQREFLWGRVAGDVFHLALLRRASQAKGSSKSRLLGAGAFVSGSLATDLYAALRASQDQTEQEKSMSKRTAITIRGPRAEVEQRWRQITQQPGDSLRGGWGGTTIFTDAPGGRGTELHLQVEENGGPVGTLAAKVKGEEPIQAAKDDLRRFKQLVEVGEVVRSEGTPDGHSAKQHLHQRPAQPIGA